MICCGREVFSIQEIIFYCVEKEKFVLLSAFF